MIEWQDDGIVLTRRAHGEDAAIVQILTRQHGRHAGLAKGAQSRRTRGTYEPGTVVQAVWRARLAEHLGHLTCEPISSPAANLLHAPDRLQALSAATAVLAAAVPEREPHPAVFDGTRALLDALESDHWAEIYVQWEVSLLAGLGFALDFSTCAGGGNDRLAYVSPRTGRAVSLSAGEPYKDRLLPLPGFLVRASDGGPAEVAQGLRLTEFFLHRHVFGPAETDIPAARRRLRARFDEASAGSPATAAAGGST
jgi:DNA repair protein RecO (recombination protein O)